MASENPFLSQKPARCKEKSEWNTTGYLSEEHTLSLSLSDLFIHCFIRANQVLGGIGGRRRRGWQRMRWLDGITDSMDMSLGKPGSRWWTGRPGVLGFMGSQRVRHNWVTELNWTELNIQFKVLYLVPNHVYVHHLSMYFTKLKHKCPI